MKNKQRERERKIEGGERLEKERKEAESNEGRIERERGRNSISKRGKGGKKEIRERRDEMGGG